jgi:hypothetical protein
VEKALETGVCFLEGPFREPGRMLICQGLWVMDVGGSRIGKSLSEGAQCGGPLAEGSFAGYGLNI